MRIFGHLVSRKRSPWDGAPPWAIELAYIGLNNAQRMLIMSAELDALTAQVHANTALLDSATTLINGIADRIAAAGVDPAALQALTDELRAKDDTLAAAVAANTPAPPATPPA